MTQVSISRLELCKQLDYNRERGNDASSAPRYFLRGTNNCANQKLLSIYLQIIDDPGSILDKNRKPINS